MSIKSCIRSMRLRTLPLSLSGVLMGIFLCAADYTVKPLTVTFLLLTTIFLQILVNLCNELGDWQHGTDTEERAGMRYSMQDGALSEKQMKGMIAAFVGLSCLSGVAMIWAAFGSLLCMNAVVFLLLGACAILAAARYTLGRNPYGYRGLGDVSVFLFFGLATVVGGYLLCSGGCLGSLRILLPAGAIGCFSVGVLNVNNIRDMKTDAATRVTVAMKMGPRWARVYQTALIVVGWGLMVAYCLTRMFDPWHYLFVLSLPLFIKHLVGVWKLEDKALDPMLPLLVMASFAFSLLAGVGFVVYLF